MRYAHGKTPPVLFAPIIAAAEPVQIGSAVLVLVTVCPILGVIISAVALWRSSQRQPPVAEEMYKRFIPRAEANATIERIDERLTDAFKVIGATRDHADTEISVVRNTMAKAFGDLERAIGRVEGKLDK